MKTRTTRKAVINSNNNVIHAGAATLSNLLINHDATEYSAGTYGWNFDVYHVFGAAICIGYRNMPGRPAKNDIIFDQRARRILESYHFNYDLAYESIENLLKEFIDQA